MISRLYAIALNDTATPDSVDDLIRILRETPQHIPSMRWSTVAPEESPAGYQLVWHNGFDDDHGYREYLRHPYHCNEIDHYMYPESTASIVAPATMCLRWSDADRGAEQGARVVVDETPILLREHVDLVPGITQSYIDAVLNSYVPHVDPLGMTLHRIESGDETLDLVWQIPGWDTWTRIRTTLYHDKSWLGSWLEVVTPMRTGGRRRFVPLDDQVSDVRP